MTNYVLFDRDRLAFHEGSHLVAGVALGCRIGAVTIDGDHGNGCAFVAVQRLRTVGDLDAYIYEPSVLWPRHVVRHLEVDALVALAGCAGETLAPGAPARSATPAVLGIDTADDFGRPWADPPALNRHERADIQRWREGPAPVDDDDYTTAVLRALHGPDDVPSVVLHARFLYAQVRQLLERRAAAVERVALALLKHKTLSGTAVRALIARR